MRLESDSCNRQMTRSPIFPEPRDCEVISNLSRPLAPELSFVMLSPDDGEKTSGTHIRPLYHTILFSRLAIWHLLSATAISVPNI